MHKILRRQLKKAKIDNFEEIEPQKFSRFISLVDQMYQDHEDDEHALQYTMNKLNSEMTSLYKRLENASKGRMQAVAGTMPDMMVLIDSDGRCVELFSLGEQKVFGPEDFDPSVCNMYRIFEENKTVQLLQKLIEHALATKNLQVAESQFGDHFFEMRIMATGLQENGKDTLILTIRNITQQRKSHDRLIYTATHDGLTDLYNRTYFQERLRQLAGDLQAGEKITILYMDLNKFKEINDIMGHDVGDKVLIEAARRLKSVAKESDIIARVGGDEFIYVCLDGNNRRHAEALAEMIVRQFDAPFEIEGLKLKVHTSIGISIYPDDAANIEQVVHYADESMYCAKREEDIHYCVFQQQIADALEERYRIEHKIKKALVNDEFHLVYQPQVELESLKITGVETLIRWEDPEMGFIPPDKFITIAEQSSLIFQIDEWVIKNICKTVLSWERLGLPPFIVAMNLSRKELGYRKNIENIAWIIQNSGIDPRRLEIEVTESALFENEMGAINNLQLLQNLGCHISIDDFGTGYSSLANLRNFTFDKIKIDKSFVDHIVTDPKDLSIVKLTIGLAKELGMRVIAEGVEDARQYELLKSFGCDEIQGYYFYQPLKAEQISVISLANFQLTTLERHLRRLTHVPLKQARD
ncbi:MAG TPA: EAL domain-containing protein [Epsilonproteobacteria bacterium]|nr:EAL domain-containing protein [Campylobacterota bacterium]